ncbi:MAG: permease [Candidatus Omnitrophota bacterium]
MKKGNVIRNIAIVAYFLFLIFSFSFGFDSGKEIGRNFLSFAVDMFKVLPFAFILIGLFEVWVKKETVEKHLGEKSGMRGFFWVILLAGTMIGGLYVALPIAHALYNKGAKLSVVFTFLGAAAITRVPMTVFEASFMGVKFTLIRLVISLPLVIITSIVLGSYLTKKGFKIKNAF